jgi:hypothetical protein
MTVVAELLRVYIQLHDVEFYVLCFLNKVEMENVSFPLVSSTQTVHRKFLLDICFVSTFCSSAAALKILF